MKTDKQIVELVVYKIKPHHSDKYSKEIINSFRKLVMSFDGFISYDFFKSCGEEHLYVDFVTWDSLDDAENAAKKVKEIQKTENYKDYLDSFEKVEIFNHFKLLNSWENIS